MSLKPSSKECKAVCEMVKHEGWNYIRNWVEAKVVECGKALLTVDPTNIAEVSRLQGQIRAYQNFLRHVDYVAGLRATEEE